MDDRVNEAAGKAMPSVTGALPRTTRRRRLTIVTMERGREVAADRAERVRLEAATAIEVNRIFGRIEAAAEKPIEVGDRADVERLMRVVERRIVEAVWTLARLPGGDPFYSRRCGVAYIQDPADRFANAVANGGTWDEPAPRPPRPSPREIDAYERPLEWLTLLERNHAKLLSTAAGTKRGDVSRNINWDRVRRALPETQGLSVRTLQRRYESGLRTIASDVE